MFTGQGRSTGEVKVVMVTGWKGWGGTRLLSPSFSALPALTTRHVHRRPRHLSPHPGLLPHHPDPVEQRRR